MPDPDPHADPAAGARAVADMEGSQGEPAPDPAAQGEAAAGGAQGVWLAGYKRVLFLGGGVRLIGYKRRGCGIMQEGAAVSG